MCEGCAKDVRRMCEAVPRMCQCCAKDVRRMCQGCAKDVRRMCEGCAKDAWGIKKFGGGNIYIYNPPADGSK